GASLPGRLSGLREVDGTPELVAEGAILQIGFELLPGQQPRTYPVGVIVIETRDAENGLFHLLGVQGRGGEPPDPVLVEEGDELVRSPVREIRKTHLVLSGFEFSLEDFQDVKRGPGSPVLGCLLQFGDDNGFTPGDDVLEGGMLCFGPNRRHPQREKAEEKHGLEGTTHQRILPNQKRPKRRRKAPRLPLSKGKKRTRTFFGIKPQKKCRSPFPAHLRAFWGFLGQALASFVRTLLDLVLRPSRISLRDCSPQGHSP